MACLGSHAADPLEWSKGRNADRQVSLDPERRLCDNVALVAAANPSLNYHSSIPLAKAM